MDMIGRDQRCRSNIPPMSIARSVIVVGVRAAPNRKKRQNTFP